jgi:hypothetical protein
MQQIELEKSKKRGCPFFLFFFSIVEDRTSGKRSQSRNKPEINCRGKKLRGQAKSRPKSRLLQKLF